MEKFRGKIFNPEVFEKYLKTLESTKENSLINNGLFTPVSKYKVRMAEQTGGYAVLEPIKGRIGGNPVNYDGNTDIPKGSERDTFFQRKICYGRAKAWGEYDFAADITSTNFKAEAGEVKEYWDEQRQMVVLAILKGIFSMTGGVDGKFVEKHTYQVAENLSADALNRASQKALGDKKSKLEIMFTHSMVTTNLEGLNLIDFLKYTDSDGIERDLTIGTYNGKMVIVDDDMPTSDVDATYAKSTDEAVDTSKTYYTRTGAGSTSSPYVYSVVSNPTGNPSTSNYYEKTAEGYTEYTSYLFKRGFFEYENIGVETPVETVRDAYDKGGKTDMISRVREMIVPTYISFKGTGTVSPTNEAFATGSNWELANNDKSGAEKVYVDDKLIPVVRIISRG